MVKTRPGWAGLVSPDFTFGTLDLALKHCYVSGRGAETGRSARDEISGDREMTGQRYVTLIRVTKDDDKVDAG